MTSEFTTSANADLADYLRVIRRHWLLILAVTAICAGLALGYTKLQPKRYESVAKVQIPEAVGQTSREQTIADLQTEVQVMKSEEVAQGATRILKDGRSVTQLLSHLKVKTPTEARVLMVTYNGKTPPKARDGASAFAQAYVLYKAAQAKGDINEQVAALDPGIASLTKQLTTTQTALDREEPDSAQSAQPERHDRAPHHEPRAAAGAAGHAAFPDDRRRSGALARHAAHQDGRLGTRDERRHRSPRRPRARLDPHVHPRPLRRAGA